MKVRCPACGFESVEGAQWCEFCKEPFVKKPKTDDLPIDPRLLQDDETIRKFLASDRLPNVAFSPFARQLAIGMLGFFLIAGLIGSIFIFLGGKPYQGPGEDYQLGKPQIVKINLGKKPSTPPPPPMPAPPPPPAPEPDPTPLPFPDWMKPPSPPSEEPSSNAESASSGETYEPKSGSPMNTTPVSPPPTPPSEVSKESPKGR